jgi:hypothetical protein
MATRHSAANKTVIVTSAIVLVVSAGLLLMGTFASARLNATYLANDLARLESPKSFRVWLLQGVKSSEKTKSDLSENIASRLLLMSLYARRQLVVTAGTNDFWYETGLSEAEIILAGEALLAGVVAALKNAPSLGGLWLLAANLEIRLNGFSETARNYLRASRIYTPNETDMVLQRINLSAIVWQLLNAGDRKGFKADFAVMEKLGTRNSQRLKASLQRAGVTFD